MIPSKKLQKIHVIHLGDELLLGLRANTHLQYLGRKFSEYGLTLTSDLVIRDHREEIIECLDYVWKQSDLVITTGGLGPTVDDITREAIADFLGLELVFSDEILGTIQQRFLSMGREMKENNRRQCYTLQGSEVLENPNGTAPGLFLEKDGKILVMLPGPPRELKPMVENQMIPRLIQRGVIESSKPYIQIRTCGIGESALEDKLQPILKAANDVQAAFCVHSGVVDVRFSTKGGKDELNIAKGCAEAARDLLEEDFVGYGEFDTAKSIISDLAAHGQRLAIAESCTGGLIAAALTDIPGASDVISGGIVAYTEETKVQVLGVPEDLIMQHGAVSAETAVAMATAAAELLSSDYGLSTTGFAGPTGGTKEDPVGTVYIGYHSPSGAWCKRIYIKGDRELVRQRTSVYALDLMRRKLRKYREQDDAFRNQD